MTPELGKIEQVDRHGPAFIVGGGDSLRDFDFSLLKGRATYGANDAAIKLKTDVFVTIDRNYYKNRTEDIKQFVKGGGTAYVAMDRAHVYEELIDGVTYLHRTRGTGMSLQPDVLYGLNSGYATLNAALLEGRKEIILLGFDMHHKSGKSHWFDGYSWHRNKGDRLVRRWAGAFTEAVEDLRANGVQVVNCVGPLGSTVTAFPTMDIADLQERLQP